MEIAAEIINQVQKEIAGAYRVVPFEVSAETISFYCDAGSDEGNLAAELQVLLGRSICLSAIPAADISRLLSSLYFSDASAEGQTAATGTVSSKEDFLATLIAEAKSLKSSDIHIEAFEKKCRVRIRIDGMMVERYTVTREDYPALINKIKIMSNLDIAEKRLPQDGRIHYREKSGGSFDIRVSVLPTLHGEKVVMRLLNNGAANIDLSILGLSAVDYENYMDGIRRPNGIILISGPTGSGKTTTLYATLKYLNKNTRNILTIEDPIEYTLEGINQVQLKESIGLGFASALRTFLRQDPDVIMVGEIRDPETANMAIRAALTGHLVLSTIHTNSAWGTVSRLMDMGIPGFLVSNTLNTSVAQRLLRLLCPACKEERPAESVVYPRNFRPPFAVENHFAPKGCPECFYTGYKGRKAVYEVIPIDQELSDEIKAGNMQVSALLEERNIKTLARNAFDLFAMGETSLEEVFPLLLEN